MVSWPALVLHAFDLGDPPDADDAVGALLDDYTPAAIEDLAERPLPPGGLWDPTYPPIPDPPPTPLRWRVFFQTDHDRAWRGMRSVRRFRRSGLKRSTYQTKTGPRGRSSR